MENEFVLIKKDVDEAYLGAQDRSGVGPGRADRRDQLLRAAVGRGGPGAAVPDLGHGRSLDLDGITAEVKARARTSPTAAGGGRDHAPDQGRGAADPGREAPG
ncbi:Keratin, type II cytoskeletal 8 [Vulpes lagopus]